jgi:hypothetical protein
MFLELLNDDQQQLFLDVAVTMAAVDGYLHLDEESFLDRVRRETGGEAETASPTERGELLERVRRAFTDGVVPRRAFVAELAGLVIADGNQADPEVEFLREVARAVSVPEADVPVFLDFAREAAALARDARDLLATSNLDN